MFYKANEPHGLPYNPFKAIVAPRPIGWISTLDKDGVPNLAPYSFFNGVCDDPIILMFGVWWHERQRIECLPYRGIHLQLCQPFHEGRDEHLIRQRRSGCQRVRNRRFGDGAG